MLLRLAGRRRVVFVGGKGGVGKTSIASAMAVGRARAGARVLVVSTDPAHNLGHLWDRPVGDAPQRLASYRVGDVEGYVDGLEIDPAATVERHLAGVRETMRRLLPERLRAQAEQHLAVAREAPGTHESAVLERIAEAVADGLEDYDLVVFDTAPTGHTVRLLAMPEQLTTWTEMLLRNRDRSDRFGAAVRGLGGTGGEVDRDAELRRVLLRRQQRFSLLRDVIADGLQTSFVIVLTAERLPVAESVDLHQRLRGLGVDVAGLVVNRRSPADAGDLLAERRMLEDAQIGKLADQVPGTLILEVPLLPGELVGEAELARLADQF
jgi:arsenite-transporting ATPase